jgi:ribosomal protein S18 acetylase RimI-like enzyme
MRINGAMTSYAIRQARPGDESGIAATQILAWAQTYDGVLPDRLLKPWEEPALATIWKRRIGEAGSRALTYVAETSDKEIAGFGICGQTRGRVLPSTGEISLLYLRRSIQRQGAGRRLMRAMSAALLARGYRSTGVWVLADNDKAVSFYEALGGIMVASRTGQFGGHATRELGFAWPSSLLARSGALKGAAARR